MNYDVYINFNGLAPSCKNLKERTAQMIFTKWQVNIVCGGD